MILFYFIRTTVKNQSKIICNDWFWYRKNLEWQHITINWLHCTTIIAIKFIPLYFNQKKDDITWY
jgi:hypothetical protein